jgi:hypothetical protein
MTSDQLTNDDWESGDFGLEPYRQMAAPLASEASLSNVEGERAVRYGG